MWDQICVGHGRECMVSNAVHSKATGRIQTKHYPITSFTDIIYSVYNVYKLVMFDFILIFLEPCNNNDWVEVNGRVNYPKHY